MAGQEKSGKKMTLHLRPNSRSTSECWLLQSSPCHCYMGAYHNSPTFHLIFGNISGARTWEKQRTTETGK